MTPLLEGFAVYHGVPVSYVDGEGDAPIALGHHDNAADVIAAMVRHSVDDCGLSGICDDPAFAARMDRPDLLSRTWAVNRGSLDDWVLWWHTDKNGTPITAATPGAFPVTLWLG